MVPGSVEWFVLVAAGAVAGIEVARWVGAAVQDPRTVVKMKRIVT